MRSPGPQQRYKNLSLGVVTVPFGGKTRQEDFHPAVDVANKMGTLIPATVDGVVTQAEGGHSAGENNFGNSVTIKTANGDQHQFHHLGKIGVRLGQAVKKGQPVATMSNTGATYSAGGQGDGTNLDYRIVTAFGRYKNPMTYLQSI